MSEHNKVEIFKLSDVPSVIIATSIGQAGVLLDSPVVAACAAALIALFFNIYKMRRDKLKEQQIAQLKKVVEHQARLLKTYRENHGQSEIISTVKLNSKDVEE